MDTKNEKTSSNNAPSDCSKETRVFQGLPTRCSTFAVGYP